MRVLITRPEREATALAEALRQRGHEPVIAPLFSVLALTVDDSVTEALAACQAVLLTSANGARALAGIIAERHKPILAVGDTTAARASWRKALDLNTRATNADRTAAAAVERKLGPP